MGSSVSTPVHDHHPDEPTPKTIVGHDDPCPDDDRKKTTKIADDSDHEIAQDSADESPRQSKTVTPSLELRRCLTKKEDLLTDLRMFQMVDQHARNTPEEMSSNCERLVTYLMSSCTSILHIVRIFYMWITINIRCISYTDESLTALEFKPTTVLAKREATPVGMNLLFYYFCSQIRIPCSLVHGILKHDNQNSSALRHMKNKPNHAWVLILVQDQWRFIDCACGGGKCDDPKETSLRREFFFLPDPEVLINSHFPIGMTNEMDIQGLPDTEVSGFLQMLETPFTFGQFWRQAMKSLVGLNISLQLLSHLSCIVRIDKGEQLSFRSPDLEDIAGILTDKTTGDIYPNSISCLRTSSSEYRIFVKPKEAGTYKLEVLGKIRGSPESCFRKLIDYEVISHSADDTFSPFPYHFGIWGANVKALHLGFSRRIFKFDTLSCLTGDLYMKLPLTNQIRVKAVISPAISSDSLQNTTNNHKSVSSINNDNNNNNNDNMSTLVMYMDGVVHIKARFNSSGFFSLALHAQTQTRPGQLLALTTSSPFTKVADFMVNCRRRSAYSSSLPKSFAMCQQFQCLLLEPLQRDLIVHHDYKFRVASPCMDVMKVDGQNMTKETDHPHDEGMKNVIWTLKYTPKTAGTSVYVYGSVKHPNTNSRSSALSALFVYHVVEDLTFGRRGNDSL